MWPLCPCHRPVGVQGSPEITYCCPADLSPDMERASVWPWTRALFQENGRRRRGNGRRKWREHGLIVSVGQKIHSLPVAAYQRRRIYDRRSELVELLV